MTTKSKHRAPSTIAALTMELREEPRQFVGSHMSMSVMSPVTPISPIPTKAMTFASEEDYPVYIHDLPYRVRDQNSRALAPRDNNWRNFGGIRSSSPKSSPSFSRDSSPPPTKETPLRPNRREDVEFGRGDPFPTSHVLLPSSVNDKVARKKSSGGKSGKIWLKNIRSPIGTSPAHMFPYQWITNRCLFQI